MLKILLFNFFLVLSVFGSTELFFIKGLVQVNGKDVSKGKALLDGDKVIVGSKSLAVIKFDKKAVIKLTENSELIIKKLNDKSESPTSLVLNAGAIFSKILIKADSGKRNFEVRAKSAVMGVRGTEFFTAYSQDKKQKNDLWMCVNEGLVEIVTDNQKGKVEVKQGEGVFIKKGSETTSPKKYAWTKKLNWKLNPSEGDLENKAMDEMYQDLLDQDYD